MIENKEFIRMRMNGKSLDRDVEKFQEFCFSMKCKHYPGLIIPD